MKLGEIMSAAGLEIFAEIGLVLFLGIFAGVLIYTFSARNRGAFERLRRAPLDDAPTTPEGDHDR